MAKARVHASGFDQTTVHESRIQPGFSVNARDHRRGCGLSVRAGNGNAVAKTHQFRQHLGAANNRNTRFVGGDDFRVIRRNRAGNHDNARIAHVFRAMVEINRGAKLSQLLGHRIRRQVGAANLITFVGQNFGNTAHAGTANANKVNVPDATHLGHDRTQFCQILCIHSLRHQLLYSDGDHHRD